MNDPQASSAQDESFISHLVELRDRLLRSLIAVGVILGALCIYPGPGAIYDFLAAPLTAALPEGRNLGKFTATFADFAADVDLDANLQGRQMGRALCRQPLCDFQPLDAVHPVKIFCHRAGFVALQRADEMPVQRQIRQFGNLVDAFLHIVFTKRQLPRLPGFAHIFGGKSLAHGQQGD